MRVLKNQSKNLLNMALLFNYFNLFCHVEVKTKSKPQILNFVFQFIENTKWPKYTDSRNHQVELQMLFF